MSKALLFSCLALLAVSAHAQDTKAVLARQNVAIVGARIEIGNGKFIPRGTVVIRDGKIAEVSDKTEAPAGIEVVKGDGMTLYPGFIDAYRTSGIKSSPDPSVEGKPKDTETAPASMWIGNRKGINAEWAAADNLDFDKEEAAHKAGITTTVFCPGRGSIRGTAAIVSLLPLGVEGRVIEPNFAMGLSFRNGTGAGYPGNILGVIALMRQTLADVKSMVDGTVLSEEVNPPSWLKSLEALRPAIVGTMPVIFEANMDREIGRALRLSDEFGLHPIITGGRDAYLVAPTLAARKVPVILAATLSPEPSLEPSSAPPADQTPLGYRQDRRDLWEQQSRSAEALAKAGVAFAFSSEGDTVGDFLTSVRTLVKRGLAKDAALTALTLGGAKILGIDSKTGSIEVGKRADVVLMSGDFADEKTTVKRVWIDGRPVLEIKEEGK